MIFLKINCPNFSRLVWRPPYLPCRFPRHCMWGEAIIIMCNTEWTRLCDL